MHNLHLRLASRDTCTKPEMSVNSSVLPWAALSAGWRPGAAPPDCGCSGRSHRAPQWASSAAYPRTQRDGYTATAGYTSACPGALSPSASGTHSSSQTMGYRLVLPPRNSLDFILQNQSNKSPCASGSPANVHWLQWRQGTSRGSHTSRATQHIHSLVQHKPKEVNKTHILCAVFSFAA